MNGDTPTGKHSTKSVTAPMISRRRTWVAWSSARSVARHDISILAMIETGAAALIYFSLALRFDRQWLLLLAALVAPVLLLRSKASIAASLAIYKRDLKDYPLVRLSRKEPPLDDLYRFTSMKGKWWKIRFTCVGLALVSGWLTHNVLAIDASASERAARLVLLACATWTVTLVMAGFSLRVLFQLDQLTGDLIKLLGVAAATAGAVVGAGIAAGFPCAAAMLAVCTLVATIVLWPTGHSSSARVLTSHVEHVASWYADNTGFARPGRLTFALTRALLSKFAYLDILERRLLPIPEFILLVMVIASLCGAHLSGGTATPTQILTAMLGAWMIVGLLVPIIAKLARPPRATAAKIDRATFCYRGHLTLWALPGYALGYPVRTLLIRLWATLTNLRAGWRALPDNWRDNLCVIDFLHPPELLPRIGRLSANLTVAHQCRAIRARDTFWMTKLTLMVSVAIAYCGLIYRWSLKSTLWLWWPIIIVLTPPFFRSTQEQQRVRTSVSARGRLANGKLFVALAVGAWLAGEWFPNIAASLRLVHGVDPLVSAMQSLRQPALGVRWIMLMATCLVTIAIWWLASPLAAAYEDALKTPDKFTLLKDDSYAIFTRRAKLIERVRALGVACVIVLGYASALHLAAAWYPTQVLRVVPGWILSAL